MACINDEDTRRVLPEGPLVQVLQNEVRCRVRGADTVCRYAEDRIGVVVDTTRVYCRRIAERLHQQLTALQLRDQSGQRFEPAVCIGAATYPENGAKAHSLIQAAEQQALSQQQQMSAAVELVAVEKGTESAVPGVGASAADDTQEASRLVDPLTGVLRSDRVGSAMQKYISRFRRDGQPVCMLHMDLDALRRYNEHYGDEAGDVLLGAVGALLRKSVREDDLIARYGGDEFLIAMPGRAAGALKAAQRVANALRDQAVSFREHRLKITACIGVAGSPDHGQSAGQLFEAANAALQDAKARGTSVCEVYESSMQIPEDRHPITDVF
jgi:diguanylate cyclase (GGDEF)-like protein